MDLVSSPGWLTVNALRSGSAPKREKYPRTPEAPVWQVPPVELQAE